MLARSAGLPQDLEPDLAERALLVENDLVHDEAQDALALRRGGRCGVPDPRQVLAQDLERHTIGLAQDKGLVPAPTGILLLDDFGGAQLLLPGPLQRARHQAVLRLDGVVLAPGSLGLVAGAFAPKGPLFLELARLLFDLPERRNRQGDLVGRQGLQQKALDQGVDGQSAHLLAERAATVVAIGPAAIDRIIPLRACVAQAHAAAAAPTRGDALEQRAALARHAGMARFVAVDVVGQALLVGHELLPADVAGVGGLQAHLPLGDGDLRGSDTRRPRPAPARIRAPTAVDIGPSIGWVLEDVAHPRAVGLAPDNLVRSRPEQRAYRQRQAVGTKVAHHGPRALQLAELGEDKPEARLDLFVRVQDDRAGAVMGQSGREGQAQLAPGRLLALALMQAHSELMQLRLAHDAGQAQKQAVVVSGRIVEPLAIGEEYPEQRAQLKQLMPVAV